MSSDRGWVRLSSVYKHAVIFFESIDTAELKLIEALRNGFIRMNGEYYIKDQFFPNIKLSNDYAITREGMIWAESRIEHKVEKLHSLSQKPNYLHLGTFHQVMLNADDIGKLWPELMADNQSTATPNQQVLQKPPRKGVGGVTPAYDWEKYLIEAAAFIYENSSNVSEADIFRYLWDKFGGDGDGPSRTQMQSHISPLIRRLKQVDRG